MTVIVSNNLYCDSNEFTKVCSSIDDLYKALCEAHDLLPDDHIHIEFCRRNKIGNNESINYEAIIWNKDITRF